MATKKLDYKTANKYSTLTLEDGRVFDILNVYKLHMSIAPVGTPLLDLSSRIHIQFCNTKMTSSKEFIIQGLKAALS